MEFAMLTKIIPFGVAATLILGVGMFGSSQPAEAKGCIKGAIVGGVAGHMAGHGKLGALAGCVIGHHAATKQDRDRRRQGQTQPTR